MVCSAYVSVELQQIAAMQPKLFHAKFDTDIATENNIKATLIIILIALRTSNGNESIGNTSN